MHSGVAPPDRYGLILKDRNYSGSTTMMLPANQE